MKEITRSKNLIGNTFIKSLLLSFLVFLVLEGVAGASPIANFSSNVSEGYSPLDVQFYDLSQNADSLLWNFGDGNTSTLRNPTHTFSSPGYYWVNLTAINGNIADYRTATITVLKTTSTITWSNPADITYGTPLSSIQLNAVASVPGTFAYSPDKGTLLSEGTHTLQTIFTPSDTTDYSTVTKTITTNVAIAPTADFTVSITKGRAPLSVAFTDKSKESPTSWTWLFGDGGSFTCVYPSNPVHTYTKTGQYTITLTVQNVAGNSTIVKSSYIQVDGGKN